MDRPSPTGQTELPQRRIELRHASIHVDGPELRRTAQFSDGSVKSVAIKWSGITRVGAFRCENAGAGLLCMAITDPQNVVILAETMEGWDALLGALPARLAGVRPASDWRNSVVHPPAAANWTVLFAASV
jgi:hypothetical protein